MDDFVVSVKQIAQYPQKSAAAASDAFLLQSTGLGGPYMWMAPTDLVSTALQMGGSLNLAPGNNIAWNGASLSWSAGVFSFSEAVSIPSLTVSGNTTAAGSITASGSISTAVGMSIAGVAAATINDVAASAANIIANSVTSFNFRTGDVGLTLDDITIVGGAPIYSPFFLGQPAGPTPIDPETCSSQLATTAFAQNAISSRLNDLLTKHPFVWSFNGRCGDIWLTADDVNAAYLAPGASQARAPSPPFGDVSTRIATTMFVDSSVSDLQSWVEQQNFAFRQDLTLYAPLASPQFSGQPTAPTATSGTNTAQLATTAFVMAAVAASTAGVASFNGRTGTVTLTAGDLSAVGGALLAAPAFTGIPTAPTATVGTDTTQLATCEFVQATTAAAAGVSSFNARTGAVTLTLADVTGIGGAPIASPSFTGTPLAVTAAVGTSTTQLATTAFVAAAIAAIGSGVVSFEGRTGAVLLTANDISARGGALVASPAFSGVPTAPTAVPSTSTTQLATTAFVMAALAAVGGVTSFNTRAGAVTLTTADVSAVLHQSDIVGVTDGSDAATGRVGEFLSVVGGPTNVNTNTTGAYTVLGSLTLPAGDWDVGGDGYYVFPTGTQAANGQNAWATLMPSTIPIGNTGTTNTGVTVSWWGINWPGIPANSGGTFGPTRMSGTAAMTVQIRVAVASSVSGNPVSWYYALRARRVR
jgi:hypothetical protein